ncbi:MAG: hypothetical protein WA354_05220 [Terracidiphilus sp.]
MNVAPTVQTVESRSRSRALQWQQSIVMAILYATPVFFVLRLDQVDDTDVWWHLRTGQWIAQHGTIPHAELFSAFAAGKPWTAYSWLFELIVYSLFHKFGLIGIAIYTSAMVVAITVGVHSLVRRLNSDFTLGVGITFLAMYTMGRLFTPRPWLLTILFFTLELNILMRSRQSGKARELLWLPLIFALWANIHIQFVDGLLVLGIALAESLLAKWSPVIKTNLKPSSMVAIFLACIAATLVNPYGWGVYKVAYGLADQMGQLSQISEFSAVPFRSLDDWCVVLLAFASLGALAWARRFLFFETILLAFSIIISFRSQRDIWVITVAGSAILAAALQSSAGGEFRLGFSAIPFIVLATALLVVLAFKEMRFDNAELQVKMAADLPEHAVEVIKQQHLGGPLYNDLNWGGFLIWSLRLPVSMDGRTNVYGSEKIIRSYETWNANPGWDSDPDLLRANLIFAPAEAPLVQLLRFQPCLRVAYEDQLAAVFLAQNNQTGDVANSFCASREKLSNQPAE